MGYSHKLTFQECKIIWKNELFLLNNKIINNTTNDILLPSKLSDQVYGFFDVYTLTQISTNILKIQKMSEFKNTTTTEFTTLSLRLIDDANDKLTRRVSQRLNLFYKIDFEYDIIAKCFKSENEKTLMETYPSFIITKNNTIIKINKIHSSMDELVSNQLQNPELISHISEHMLKVSQPSVNLFEKKLIKCLNYDKLNEVFICKFVNIDNKIDINQIFIYIFLLFGIIIITYKIIKFFKELNVNFNKFAFNENTDWYQTNLIYSTPNSNGLDKNDIDFITNFLEFSAAKNSFKIKIFIRSEDNTIEYDVYNGFKLNFNYNKIITDLLETYKDTPQIRPILKVTYINLIWIIDENGEWKKKKKELENSIQNKKLTLVQKFKFMKKSTINTQYNPTIFSKRTFSTAFSKKKNFSQILKNNIPTMDYNLINELIENKEKKKKTQIKTLNEELSNKYIHFSKVIENSITKIDTKFITNEQKHDISDKVIRFILVNNIINKNNTIFITLGQLVNFIYNYLEKIHVNEHEINKLTRIIISAIIQNKDFFIISKTKIGTKDVYKNNSEKGKDTWIINLINYKELYLIKDQFSNIIKEYLISSPRNWKYENGNAFGGYDSAYKIVYKKLIDINVSNKICFKEIGNELLIKKINNLQTIGCKYNIDIFISIFSKYTIDFFNNLLYKKREQFYEVIKKLYSNEEFKILKLKTKESFGLQKEQLHIFLLIVLFFKKIMSLKPKTLIYNNIRLDHRLRYYYSGLYNHMNSKILRPLVQLYPFSLPEKKISDNIKFYISWQISKSENIEEALKKYNEFKNTSIKDKTKILEFRNSYNWLITMIAIKENKPFTISLDACASFQQIISILIRDSKLAKLTNISNISNQIYDPYNFICEIIKKNIPIEFEDYKDIISNRKIVKQIIMTHTYGSNAWSIINNLQDSGNLILLKKNKITIKLFNFVIQKFHEEFPNIKKFMEIMKIIAEYLCKKNKPIHFKYKQIYTKFTTNKMVNNIVNVEIDETKTKIAAISISKRKNNQISLQKTTLGLLPNLIHFLDAQILLETRVNLKNKKIYTLGVHDCIIIDHKYYNECVFQYNKSLSELTDIDIFDVLNIKKEDIINYLQTTNKKKYDNFIENIKIFDAKKIEDNEILKSKFTLLPT